MTRRTWTQEEHKNSAQSWVCIIAAQSKDFTGERDKVTSFCIYTSPPPWGCQWREDDRINTHFPPSISGKRASTKKKDLSGEETKMFTDTGGPAFNFLPNHSTFLLLSERMLLIYLRIPRAYQEQQQSGQWPLCQTNRVEISLPHDKRRLKCYSSRQSTPRRSQDLVRVDPYEIVRTASQCCSKLRMGG